MNPRLVCILLSTYNGERYLTAQIESIQAQTYRDWKLLIRDDGSSDSTFDIVKEISKNDSRVQLLNSKNNLGVIKSFSTLLESAYKDDFEIFLFCDQDDVWYPNKIEISLNGLKNEIKNKPNLPILLHTDLEVVNSELSTIAPSFMQYQRIKHQNTNQMNTLLCQNFVTGNTTIFNRELAALAIPFPNECLMHDWWLAQLAAIHGKLGFIEKQTIKYRQHSSNVVGAKKINFTSITNILNTFTRSRINFLDTFKQAKLLLNKLDSTDPLFPLIKSYTILLSKGRVQRFISIRKWKLKKQSFTRQIVMMFLLLILPKKE